jgi:hypothetical protein
MTSKAFLSPLGFKFQVKKLPTFVDYVQSVNFPNVMMGETPGVLNPFQRINIPGEHMEFGQLSVTFKLDADMANYIEIFDWIKGLAKPDNFDQYRVLSQQPKGSGLGPQVDATLTILDSDLKANIEFYFSDIFPKELSGFKLDYTMEDVQYITADVQFSYNSFTYKIV